MCFGPASVYIFSTVLHFFFLVDSTLSRTGLGLFPIHLHTSGKRWEGSSHDPVLESAMVFFFLTSHRSVSQPSDAFKKKKKVHIPGGCKDDAVHCLLLTYPIVHSINPPPGIRFIMQRNE